jgi:hypothetical protein
VRRAIQCDFPLHQGDLILELSTFQQISFSSAHFVGYVLDEEPIDAIMKKFEELERFEKELAQAQPAAGGSASADSLDADQAMTDTQLEELFKRTSNYTVKGAVDAVDEYDLLQLELLQSGEDEDAGREDSWEDGAEEESVFQTDSFFCSSSDV